MAQLDLTLAAHEFKQSNSREPGPLEQRLLVSMTVALPVIVGVKDFQEYWEEFYGVEEQPRDKWGL